MSADFSFDDLFHLVVFFGVLALFSVSFGRLGITSIVGEIVAGILLGPELGNLPPFQDALALLGEVGFVILVIEAGLDVDPAMLKKLGLRSLGVAVLGSMIPLGLGFMFSRVVLDLGVKSSFIVGATLAPTSVGIAIKVLDAERVLRSPTGQLVIAAAVIDDVIGLILLSEIEALDDGTTLDFLLPVISSVAYLVLFGYLALHAIPKALRAHVIPIFPPAWVGQFTLCLMLSLAVAMMWLTHASKTSHLLGAFLAGLSFCVVRCIHASWEHHVRQIRVWLLRLFFAATVGFQIPILDFWNGRVLGRAFLFFVCILGKLFTGVLASPLDLGSFLKTGLAMSAWGEFAFVIANRGRDDELIDGDTYSALLLAVLLSTIFGPIGLRMAIRKAAIWDKKRALKARKRKPTNEEDLEQPAEIKSLPTTKGEFYALDLNCDYRPGLVDLLMKLFRHLNLRAIEFRVKNFNKGQKHHMFVEVLLNNPDVEPARDHRERKKRTELLNHQVCETISKSNLEGHSKLSQHHRHHRRSKQFTHHPTDFHLMVQPVTLPHSHMDWVEWQHENEVYDDRSFEIPDLEELIAVDDDDKEDDQEVSSNDDALTSSNDGLYSLEDNEDNEEDETNKASRKRVRVKRRSSLPAKLSATSV
eukprot:m.76211 g.76211  ORF g.76211 m.76211 type:complete len:643 (+) comp20582_c0_seq2:102-2030(+)